MVWSDRGSNGNSFVTMLQLQQVTKTYDVVANVGYRDFGNYEDGNQIEIPSSFKSTDYGLKFGYNLSENQRLQAHWRQSFGRDVLHAGLPMDTEYDNSSILSLDYKWSNIGDVLKSITAKMYYSYVDHLMTNNLDCDEYPNDVEGFKDYIKKYQQIPNHERLNKIIEDIIKSGRIQKDDLTIVTVDG